MVRIAAAICSAVLGLLLAWVVAITFVRPEPMVVPSNGVIGSSAKDPLPTQPQAEAALGQRTQLQRWRAESGPSPQGKQEPSLAITGAEMPRGDREADDRDAAKLPDQWLAARDKDWPVLVQRGYTEGQTSLPLARDSVLMQPQGRDFRRRHESTVPYAGGWIIFGISFALSLFLLVRGRVALAKGFSGQEIERFNALERANHWMTASSFILLALTGLILIYGWALLQPLLGAYGYGVLARGGLYVHIASAAPFAVGICVMAVLWLRENLPTRLDLRWLSRFGGFLSDASDNPPARRFNAGQKLVFWVVVIGGVLMLASGVALMLPFFWTGVVALQWVLLGHGLLALLMVGLILGHIYIGTIGMEGAFDAMWSGRVDRNWAEEHHQLWVEELEQGERSRAAVSPTPAE